MASMLDRALDSDREARDGGDSWLSPVRGIGIGIMLGLAAWVLLGTLVWTLA